MNEGTPVIIKKKKGHGGHVHHGGSWKVAYADFVTAMMAFFMVMWIMGLSDQTRAQIAGYFNDPLGVMKTMPRSKAVMDFKNPPPEAKRLKLITTAGSLDQEQMRSLEQKIKGAISDGKFDLQGLKQQVEVTITPEGLQIELVENTGAVFFETGSAVVRPVAVELMHDLTPIIAKSGRKLIIEGHTDARPYPSSTYNNWDLSSDRANAIRRLMDADGLGQDQLIQVRGYAATKLKDPQHPYRFSNRRVTLLLPFKDLTEPLLDLPKESFGKETQIVTRQPLNVLPKDIDLSGGNAPDEPHSQP